MATEKSYGNMLNQNKGIKMQKMEMESEGMESEEMESESAGTPGEYSEEYCHEAVETLKEADKIRANPELMAKLKPMMGESEKPDSSKGLDGLRETAKKRIKELA